MSGTYRTPHASAPGRRSRRAGSGHIVAGCATGSRPSWPRARSDSPPPATFVVTKEADTNGVCIVANCSLREAVNAANALDGDDTITVPSGTYTLTGAAGDDAGATGDLDVTDADDNLIVEGAGAGPGGTTIDGNDGDRVFDVLSFAQLELRSLRVLDGNGQGGAIQNNDGDVLVRDSVLESNHSGGDGGAIYSFGIGRPRVAIDDSTLTGNDADSDGGAIHNQDDSRLVITNSTLTGNDAVTRGGAIYNQNQGTATIAGSAITGNSAGFEGGGLGTQNDSTLTVVSSTIAGNESTTDQAGGIWAQNSSTVTIAGSTVNGNRSLGTDTNDGGGGLWAQNDVVVTLLGSTFSGNHAERHGGGLYVRNFVWLTVLNSTIAGNDADQSGGGLYAEQQPVVQLESSTVAANTALGAGGGLFDDTSDFLQPFRLENTIVAGNAAAGVASDCAGAGGGAFTSFGHNLDGTGQCDLTGPGDIPNGNAQLGPLASNGGPTQTLALLAGSQAIDAGSGDCPSTDQRGVGRPQGAGCDIGAFEAPAVPGAPGTPAAPPSLVDAVRPVVSRLVLRPKSFRAAARGGSVAAAIGTRVGYRLSEPARTRFTVERATTGRRVGRRCVKRNRRNAGRRQCRRYERQRGSFADSGERGTNSFRFTGRLRRHALRPGRYRLVAVATDAAGNRSAPKRTSFRIVRR